jgi:hypothetical protein
MIEGLLQEIPLAEVLQLLSMNAATGDLEVVPLFPAHHPRAQMPIGHIVVREGQPHAAFLDDRAPAAALENMFLWEAGWFTFRPRETSDLPPPNLDREMHLVILSGIRRQDAWHQARNLIPTMHAILSPLVAAIPEPEQEHFAKYPSAADILLQVDGQTQLDAIATRLRLGRLRCREAAAQLLFKGLVAQVAPSAGERLVRLVVDAAYPMLGVAAEIFCDDALRAVGLPPEHLARVTTLTIAAVAQVVGEMQIAITAVLGPERAADLAEVLRAALGLAAPVGS